MINGMQITYHMPIFDVHVPDNSKIVLTTLVDIATFDMPHVNIVSFFGKKALPNSDATFMDSKDNKRLAERLAIIGYESHYLAVIMGSIYIFMLLTIIGLITILLLSVIPNHVTRKITRKLIDFFCWNFVMRLII